MADILPERNDLALGAGWNPLETYLSTSFRWVDNDARFFVACVRPGRYTVKLTLEPGPGLDLKPFQLEFRRADGSVFDRAEVRGKQQVTVVLPIDTPELREIVLHVEGGGKTNGADARVLNFRVFSLDVERGPADVLPFSIKLGEGWHALEVQNGQAFRWVGNDAELLLPKEPLPPLKIDVEAGPSLSSKRFRIDVLGDGGISVATAEIDGRGIIALDLSSSKSRVLKLHVDGGGKRTATDPRVMNFRLFRVPA